MESPGAKITIKRDARLDGARVWLQRSGIDSQSDLHDVAGDASSRRYFRLKADGVSKILMDAPPPNENVAAFVDIAGRLRSAGLHAPEIYHVDLNDGYMLLEDLGDDLYRELLHGQNADALFPALFEILKVMALTVNTRGLPVFDAQKLHRDMDLFPDWYLQRHRSSADRTRFDKVWKLFCNNIIDSALAQPQCFVHRDFHSCNLLKTDANGIGIIDFQDGVIGPISYDFISLIWDRYLSWPRSDIENWMEEIRLNLELQITPDNWRRYCDLMGLQRNLKIVGIFARLYYRDGKSGYIEMIPRFYDYITSTLRLYPEFKEVLTFMEQAECAP